jgi:hypothetical protein
VSHPLFVASYPYGDTVGDDESQFIPNNKGEYYKLNSNDLPTDILENLGYGAKTAPLALVLSKNLEFYSDQENQRLTLPFAILPPGKFFNSSIVLQEKNNDIPFTPTEILKANSGARTIFALPYLTCQTSFTRLQRNLGPLLVPNDLYDHCQFFSSIAKQVDSDWSTKLLYFSQPWIDSITKDPAWIDVRKNIKSTSPTISLHTNSEPYFNIFYSVLLNKVNHVINPYLTDSMRHIFNITLGAYPGLAPMVNEDLLPLRDIQHALYQHYGLKNFIPTIIGPTTFNYKSSDHPIYYSLQYPTTTMFSPRTKKTPSTLSNLDGLKLLFQKFVPEITKEDGKNGTFKLKDALKNCEFSFIHNHSGASNELHTITEVDPRLSYAEILFDKKLYKPSLNGKLFRGCIMIRAKSI